MRGLLFAPLIVLYACAVVGPVTVRAQPEGTKIDPQEYKRITGVDLRSNHYSGYLDTVGDRKTFFYFVESEVNPQYDPLLLWFNGGPGCSSLLGLFTENGPVSIGHGGKFYSNPYAWSNQANVLYMESPPGVGFSTDTCYTPSGVDPVTNETTCTWWNDTATAEVNYQSLLSFMEAFPQCDGAPLYISGESYAGHYVPQLAHKIFHGVDETIPGYENTYNFSLKNNMMKGFMVGNPCTGHFNGSDLDLCFIRTDPTLTEFFKGHAFLSFNDSLNTNETDDWGYVTEDDLYDVYDIEERYCQWSMPGTLAGRLRPESKGFTEKSFEEKMMDNFRAIQSKKQQKEKEEAQEKNSRGMQAQAAAGEKVRNVLQYAACGENWLTVFLNRPEVMTMLHAKLRVDQTWAGCSPTQEYPTPEGPDSRGVLPIYRDLMDNTNWKLLVYSGDVDSVVNFIQTQKVIRYGLNRPSVSKFLPWYYMDQYNNSWSQIGGFYVKYDRVSWASVKGAGHMVPSVRPAPAWQLLRSFLATGEPGMTPELRRDFRTEAPGSTNTNNVLPGLPPSQVSINMGLFFGGIFTGLMTGIIFTCCWARWLKRKNLWGDE